MIKKEQEDMFETVELQTAQDVDTSPTDVVMSDSPDITSPEWNESQDYVFKSNYK